MNTDDASSVIYYRDEFRRYYTEMQRWSDALYQRWITEAVFAASIKLRWRDEIIFLVGYDPQKLLPSPGRLMREWYERFMDTFMQRDLTNLALSTYIDFDRPIGCALPVPFVPRWNEADSDPFGDIQRWKDEMTGIDRMNRHKVAYVGIDYSEIDLRALMHDAGIQTVFIRAPTAHGKTESHGIFPKMFAAPPEFEKPVATAAGLRDKSYLKHDPSKNTRKVKRGNKKLKVFRR